MPFLDDATLNRLRYRRQFIFGPRPVKIPGEWNVHQITRDWALTIQRDLPFRQAQSAGGAQILLLGFAIDPENPELDDNQLLERICKSANWDELLRATVNLSGRWVLFHVAGRQVRLLNDATALRSVYFSVPGQEPWCFSQPGLYRLVRDVDYSPGAIEFVQSKESQKDFEVCFPAASSPYKEVAHLLSNHYLDLETQESVRFWPNQRLPALALQQAVAESARILQQSMRAIVNRGPTAFAVTAGRDSRTLLAASRAVADKLWVHTAMYGELNPHSPDFRVSAQLCAIAGVKQNIIPCPKRMTEPFASVFMKNHDPSHHFWGRISQGFLEKYPADTISVRGNVSEAARCVFYAGGIHPAYLDGADLARRCKMPVIEFTRHHFDEWLADAAPAAEAFNYKVLDLFFLEHRMPNWLALSQTQYDIVYETFSPYSNRRLISTMLATPPSERIKPASKIYRELIQRMWPELLPFPFNPPDRRTDKLLHKVRKAQGQLKGLLGRHPLGVRLRLQRSSNLSSQ